MSPVFIPEYEMNVFGEKKLKLQIHFHFQARCDALVEEYEEDIEKFWFDK